MSAMQLLHTAGLLGLFVLLGGCYALCYGVGRLRGQRGLIVAGFASYGLQCLVAATLLFFTPLFDGWKALIALSCVLYLAAPPLAWRGLAALHRPER